MKLLTEMVENIASDNETEAKIKFNEYLNEKMKTLSEKWSKTSSEESTK